MTVGMRHKGGRIDLFDKSADGIVFAALILVANNGHLRSEVFFTNS